ncbi:MAG: SMI1/KNR4 family protein, partial [Kofleriaceae bacterium]
MVSTVLMGDALLERWREIVSAKDPEAAKNWDDEPSGFFLHAFRPDGEGLEPLFDGMPGGVEVLARLQQVFAVAGDDSGGQAYFIPVAPPAATASALHAWATAYLRKLAQIARHLGARGGEAIALTEDALAIEVVVGPAPDVDRVNPPPMTSFVYELVTEFGGSLPRPSAHGEYLRDPLYYLACDYELTFYVLWPHIAAKSPIADPFAPYFELWRHGASLDFGGPAGRVHVSVPRLAGDAPAAPPLPCDDDASGVDAAWSRFEGRGRELVTRLRKGARPAEIAELEQQLGRRLWTSLRASLVRHDGTAEADDAFDGLELLGTERIASVWRTSCAEGPAMWVPVAIAEPRMLCLDARGAVVEVDAHFESEPRPVAASFAAWLAERAARYAPGAD